MNVRNLKLLALSLALAGAIQNPVLSGVHASWEWDGSERTLTYSFDLDQRDKEALEKAESHLKNVKTFDEISNGEHWKEWVREAARRWNNAKTGWWLSPVWSGGTLRVVSGEWDNNVLARLFVWGYECRNGTELWTRGVIVINTAEQWDETDSNKLHPVRTVMHEFGHTFLLDHNNTTVKDIMYEAECCSSERDTPSCGEKMAPLRSINLSEKDKADAYISALLRRNCDMKREEFGPRSVEIWSPDVTHRDVIGYLFFNVSHPLLSHRTVIDAIECAIDRDELADCLRRFYDAGRLVFARVYPLLDSLIPPQYAANFAEESYVSCRYQDLWRARQLLVQSGHTEGLEIELVFRAGVSLYEHVALVLREQLALIGLHVVLEPTPWPQLAANRMTAPISLQVFQTYSTEHILNTIYWYLEPLQHSCHEWSDCYQLLMYGRECLQAAVMSKEGRYEQWLRAQESLWQGRFVIPLFMGVFSTEPLLEH